jgi:hypothetical protein
LRWGDWAGRCGAFNKPPGSAGKPRYAVPMLNRIGDQEGISSNLFDLVIGEVIMGVEFLRAPDCVFRGLWPDI